MLQHIRIIIPMKKGTDNCSLRLSISCGIWSSSMERLVKPQLLLRIGSLKTGGQYLLQFAHHRGYTHKRANPYSFA